MSRHFSQESRTGRESVKNWNRADIPQAVKERAATKVVRSSTGCWISTYSVASHGYAQIGWRVGKVGGKRKSTMVLAHRASWEFVNGPVPVGMTLDHMCKEKRCVNPDHLRLMDNFENGRRTHGRNWDEGECANGHPNSLLAPDPHRRTKAGAPRVGLRCPVCVKVYSMRAGWRKQHKGEPYPEDLRLAAEKLTD